MCVNLRRKERNRKRDKEVKRNFFGENFSNLRMEMGNQNVRQKIIFPSFVCVFIFLQLKKQNTLAPVSILFLNGNFKFQVYDELYSIYVCACELISCMVCALPPPGLLTEITSTFIWIFFWLSLHCLILFAYYNFPSAILFLFFALPVSFPFFRAKMLISSFSFRKI